MREELTNRIHAVEQAYEFMLAYAAQGLRSDTGSQSGGQLRELMGHAVEALTGLDAVIDGVGQPTPEFHAFRDLVATDAGRALVAMRLVLAQPSISSELIDNLNASIHVRTLLTDLFLLDDVLA